MSLVSPLARDLVVAYLPLLPVRLVELLRGARDRDRRGAGGRVRLDGRERPRAGAACRARARAKRRDATTPRARGRRGAHVRRRRVLEGRRRADVPDAPATFATRRLDVKFRRRPRAASQTTARASPRRVAAAQGSSDRAAADHRKADPGDNVPCERHPSRGNYGITPRLVATSALRACPSSVTSTSIDTFVGLVTIRSRKDADSRPPADLATMARPSSLPARPPGDGCSRRPVRLARDEPRHATATATKNAIGTSHSADHWARNVLPSGERYAPAQCPAFAPAGFRSRALAVAHEAVAAARIVEREVGRDAVHCCTA